MLSALAGLVLLSLAQEPTRVVAPPPPASPRRKGPVRAKANLGPLISNDDYPAEALRNEEEGIVGFRLDIGTDGAVTRCTVVQTSGSASLDTATCRILSERARFTPALNRKGKPVSDHVTARIVWRILEEEPGLPPFEPTLFVMKAAAVPGGEPACSVLVNAQPAQGIPCEPSVRTVLENYSEITAVTIHAPDGKPRPVDSGDHGTLLSDTEVLLSVAADGSVTTCQTQRHIWQGYAQPNGADPCASYRQSSGPIFRPIEGESVSRMMTVINRGYARASPDGVIRARGTLGTLIGSEDYPAEALLYEEEGIVKFRLEIGTDGRATNCTITESSGSGSLDSATCRLMSERAQLTPARDAKGNAVADRVTARVVWSIAGEPKGEIAHNEDDEE